MDTTKAYSNGFRDGLAVGRTEPLTKSDALNLAAIVSAVQKGGLCAWLADAEPNGVAYGHVRSIGDERGAFANESEDIRDCFLRITTERGWELFRPMREVLEEHAKGLFVLDPTRI